MPAPELLQHIDERLAALKREATSIEVERRKLTEAKRILDGRTPPAKKRGRPAGSKNKSRVA